jgi:hypothetical protein
VSALADSPTSAAERPTRIPVDADTAAAIKAISTSPYSDPAMDSASARPGTTMPAQAPRAVAAQSSFAHQDTIVDPAERGAAAWGGGMMSLLSGQNRMTGTEATARRDHAGAEPRYELRSSGVDPWGGQYASRMASDEQFAVIATPDPVPAVVDRALWPLHVTVAGNFRVDAPAGAAMPALLKSIADDVPAFDVQLGPLDHFGAGKNIPVLLASHPLLAQIHRSLAAELAHSTGFSPVEPEYWGDGYRAHATLGRAVNAQAGDVLRIRTLTLVSLLPDSGRRLFATDLA